MFVMVSEPYPEIDLEIFSEYFDDENSVENIALAFAIAHNKFWWFEDNSYELDEDSEEYINICAVADAWGAHMDFYKDKIFNILKKEGIIIPKKGQIKVLEPFMKRYGYIDGNGWWIALKNSKNT